MCPTITTMNDMDQAEFIDGLTDLASLIQKHDARAVSLAFWKFYPTEAQALTASLIQTQHTKRLPRLLDKDANTG